MDSFPVVRNRRISRRGCVGIIDAAASLSMAAEIAWVVDDAFGGRSPDDLAHNLVALRRHGAVFALPADAGRWFPLSFAIAEARYALGFQFVWGLSAVIPGERSPVPSVDAVEIVMWWLTGTMPRDCTRDLTKARHALSAAYHRI